MLVDHAQHPEGPATMGARLLEVIGPDMMAPAGPKPDAGAIVQPETPSPGLLVRHLQSFLPPDPRHALGIDRPALGAQQRRHAPIAVAAILPGKVDGRFGQRKFVVRSPYNMPLGGASLAEHSAGSPFETLSLSRTCSTQQRRRAALRRFPTRLPSGSACPRSDQRPPCGAGHSPSQAPSAAWPAQP